MSIRQYGRALALPLRSGPVRFYLLMVVVIVGVVMAVAAASFWVAAGLCVVFGFVLLPGSTRYLMHVAEQSAAGRPPEPPGTEMFTLLGNFWPLLALLLPVAGVFAWHWLDRELGRAPAAAGVVIFAVVYPAMVGVLVITHSVAEACRPKALLRLMAGTSNAYWYAPVTALAVVGVPYYLTGYSAVLAVIAFLYLLFAFFAVVGTVMRKPRLIDEVALPDSIEPVAPTKSAHLVRQRTAVLTHAYGFASRGNRQGALRHIDAWLREDPDPSAARAWFFEQLLGWEQPDAGLHFAQAYVHELLARGEQVKAVKVMLRARLINAGFRPRPEDLPLAIEAAEASGNSALADALRRS